jgi:hypothetical protein
MVHPRIQEITRVGLLGVVSGWLMHPFATARIYGAGDALWYADVLADFVLQLRAGIFPVFVGQTEFAFNGAVYPLRVAPLYQHLGGIIDLISGHSLGFIELQHLEVILCGVAGIYASYFTLCRIAPRFRWFASGFAVLYISCPGLLGTIFTQDLYMTWMTVPLAPLAVFGILRTFESDDFVGQVWLAAPLASLWWAHSPIALWFTIVAASSQVLRLATGPKRKGWFGRAAFGTVVFLLLAQYPFISLYSTRVPGPGNVPFIGSLSSPTNIVENVRAAFPAVLLPLSSGAMELSDLQLGWGLWTILLVSAACAVYLRRLKAVFLLATACLLLLLVTYVPGVTRALWQLLPDGLVRITYYWPMQRFYIIVAAILAAAGQIIFSGIWGKKALRRVLLSGILLLACAWSIWEARSFELAAGERIGPSDSAWRVQRPENVALMDHSYGLFNKLPKYFSNGVVNPRSEFRITPTLQEAWQPNQGERLVQMGHFSGHPDANPGILNLEPTLRLSPHSNYHLKIEFKRPELAGILQVSGTSIFREYALPSSGRELSFGSGPTNSKTMDLWTTGPVGDTVRLRYIPMQKGIRASDLDDFGDFRLSAVDRLKSDIDVRSLAPLEMMTRARSPSTLETPRVFIPGYLASIDGQRTNVLNSKEGLVSIPIPAGNHTVRLWYGASMLLKTSYLVALFSWIAVFASALYFRLDFRNLSAPSRSPEADN